MECPELEVHMTSAFPLNFTDSDSILQSLSNYSVTLPETQSPLVNVLFRFTAGSYETERLFTVPDMVFPRCRMLTECTQQRLLRWVLSTVRFHTCGECVFFSFNTLDVYLTLVSVCELPVLSVMDHFCLSGELCFSVVVFSNLPAFVCTQSLNG